MSVHIINTSLYGEFLNILVSSSILLGIQPKEKSPWQLFEMSCYDCEPLLIVKGDDRGHLAPTKRFCGFDSRLVLGLVIPNTLKMGVVPTCMVLMMKYEP